MPRAVDDAARESADVVVGRGELRDARASVVDRPVAVECAVRIERNQAIFDKDKPALAAVDALQAELDSALSQSRVEARNRTEKETIPPELLTDTTEPAPEGGEG